MKYPMFKVHINSETASNNLKNVLESGFFNEGAQVTEFSKKLSEKMGYENIVMTNSCTSSLTMALKLSNVNLNYTIDSKSINILKNISFEADNKETISVVGESGSGKTSLIMLIGGLEKVSSGNIFFRDSELSKMNEDEISKIRRKNIGIVFQSFYLIPNYTALENVSLSLEINKFDNPTVKAKEILDRFGLSNRFNNFPSQLSGGEQQRVAIARSVAMKPELIVADEPTGNLDSENTDKISSLLFNYIEDENASLIMVTHDNNLANLTKRKIIIKDGVISENK